MYDLSVTDVNSYMTHCAVRICIEDKVTRDKL